MANIVNAGRAKIAAKQGSGEPLLVTHFVFAFIDGLDPEDEVDLGEVMPDFGDIVHTEPVGGQGYVSLDKVVYSTILGPDIGNFTFNWVGLVDEDDVLIAVSYVPPQYKYKTLGLDVGNTLTRNFLMQFNNAQETTGITVEAEAWQIDFLGRLHSMHEDVRRDMADIFGEGFFIENGFLIYVVGSDVYATAGAGYVGGWRVSLNANQLITTGVLPKDIYIEAWLDAGASSSEVVYEFKSSAAGAPLSTYTNTDGVVHYLVKIASVTAGYAVTDLRKRIGGVTHSIMQTLLDISASKAPLASPSFSGSPTVPTIPAGTVGNQIANADFVEASFPQWLSIARRKSLTVTTGGNVVSGNFYYWDFGKLRFFSFYGSILEGQYQQTICSLPVADRPHGSPCIPIFQRANWSAEDGFDALVNVLVLSSGNIDLDVKLSLTPMTDMLLSGSGFWRVS